MKILAMNDKLFAQRRRVMAALYDARNVLKRPLPRIKVRIVDFGSESNTLGKCFIDKDYITISHELVEWTEGYLRHVVWHELGHAYFKAKHNDRCPLMAPTIGKPGSRAVLAKALLKIARGQRTEELVYGEVQESLA